MMRQTPNSNHALSSSSSKWSSNGSSFGSVNTYHGPSNFKKTSKNPLLTVFQAAPLAYFQNSEVHPVAKLDFESERRHLTESLTDGCIKIDLSFDIATTERLNTFLARGEGQALHFSCHGHPDYLAIEDGWGAMHQLPVEKLKDWISAGGDNLLFVFVSACHSRSAGEAFLRAGVKHVVCCEQDDQPIRNLVSVQFARAFYEALANGKLLGEAFELARQGVKNYPYLDPIERQKEVDKLALLPADIDHNIRIFEPSVVPSIPQKIINHQSSSVSDGGSDYTTDTNRVLPVPPQVLEGRQVDIFHVLTALKEARLVRVSGSEAGIGKCCVVKAVCQYIQERRNIFSLEFSEILWLPCQQQGGDDAISKILKSLCSLFHSSREDGQERCYQQFFRYLYQGNKNFLIVIDARQARCTNASHKVASFVKDIIQTTRARVIVIHNPTDAATIGDLPCVERDVTLKALDFISTVHLFGKLCQHVANRRCQDVSNHLELSSLLIPNDSLANKPHMSSRGRNIFKMIGEGIPAKIHHAAKHMMPEEYDRMIMFGRRKHIVLEFKSRVALEKELSNLAVEVAKATEEKRFLDAQKYQDQFDEMEILRERLPELRTLLDLADSIHSDQQSAVKDKEFRTAHQIQEQYDALQDQIKIERTAMKELGIKEEDVVISSGRATDGTRIELEAQISAFEQELQAACDKNDISRARKVHSQIEKMKEFRKSLPSREELLSEKKELESCLKQAKSVFDWDLAEDLLGKIGRVNTGIDRELQAASLLDKVETTAAGNSHAHSANSQPGAFAIKGTSVPEAQIDNDDSDFGDVNLIEAIHSGNAYCHDIEDGAAGDEAPMEMCQAKASASMPRYFQQYDDTIELPAAAMRKPYDSDVDEVIYDVAEEAGEFEEDFFGSQLVAAYPVCEGDEEGKREEECYRLEEVVCNRQDEVLIEAKMVPQAESENLDEQLPIPATLHDVPKLQRKGGVVVNNAQRLQCQTQGVTMGHTDRLVLEQMIQESISNMVVPAVKVEKIDLPEKRNRAKKKSIKTLFGLKKSKG